MLGKFLAAWLFTALALALTFPLWLTVNYLGSPDNGAILAAYLGSLLLAGGFLAIGSCMSALTRNQVIAFILGVVACFVFLLAGFPLVLDVFRSWAPQALVDAVASLSFLTSLRVDRQGGHRRARPAVFRDADRLLPARDRRSRSTCARRTRSGHLMIKRSTLGGGALWRSRCCSSA